MPMFTYANGRELREWDNELPQHIRLMLRDVNRVVEHLHCVREIRKKRKRWFKEETLYLYELLIDNRDGSAKDGNDKLSPYETYEMQVFNFGEIDRDCQCSIGSLTNLQAITGYLYGVLNGVKYARTTESNTAEL